MSWSCCAGQGHGHLVIKISCIVVFRGDEYQGHVAQVEVIAMQDYKLSPILVSCIFFASYLNKI